MQMIMLWHNHNDDRNDSRPITLIQPMMRERMTMGKPWGDATQCPDMKNIKMLEKAYLVFLLPRLGLEGEIA